MFKHGLYPYAVEDGVAEGQAMRVGYEVGVARRIYVRADNLHGRVQVQRFRAGADCAASDHENRDPGRMRLRDLEHLETFRRRNAILARHEGPKPRAPGASAIVPVRDHRTAAALEGRA